jgi:hypothetical protein
MAAAISGDFSNLYVGIPAAHHRHNSTSVTGKHSASPSGRITSPIVQSPSMLSPVSPRKTTTPGGTVGDDSANPRLSSNSFSTFIDDSEEGAGRVPIDRMPEEDAVAESSDDQQGSSDSEGESRGRSRDSKEGSDVETPETAKPHVGEGSNQTQSPQKRQSHSEAIKSLLEPRISVTGPSGEKMGHPDTGVHPSSNFDSRRPSISATSMASNDDDADAIAMAKSLGLGISPLDTKVPGRHCRVIIRGEWARLQGEAEAQEKSLRRYVTCTDLSVEATYALEWTVGTILRDGDTLLAIYCIEDENAVAPGSSNKVSEAEKEKLHLEGAQAGKDASDAMDQLTRQATNTEGGGKQSNFVPATELQSLTGSVDARKVGKKEMERLKAIDGITQNFLRLVRKTTLQVRCMVEVIHCKSPKHLILGAVSAALP